VVQAVTPVLRVLLAAHPTVGHTQALRAIGRELLSRGHAVAFALPRVPRLPWFVPVPAPLRAASGLATQIDGDGFEPVATPSSLRAAFAAARVASTHGYDELDWAVELFTGDLLDTARRLVDEIRARRADVVVADYLFHGAWLAARATSVPHVAVFHSGLPFPAEGEPPFGSGLPRGSPREAWIEAQRRLDGVSRKLDLRVDEARRALGLPQAAPSLITRPYARDLNVLTTFEAFEVPRPDLARLAAGPLLWAGPCLGSRADEGGDFPWDRLAGDRPLVYVSLGTVFNDRPEVYARLLEGVHLAGARAVVAAGASFERVRALAAADDVVVRFAPQVRVLARAGAFIGHGGNNSTNEALRAGRPLLVVPFGAEQIANGQRVVAIGAGEMLAVSSLTPDRVATKVAALLSPDARERSGRIAAGVPEADGAITAASAIEALRAPPPAQDQGHS
jgi:MGT family glycosyltransferase